MSERYWITGVQLAMIKMGHGDIVETIVNKQFIGNYETDEDKGRFERQIKKMKP